MAKCKHKDQETVMYGSTPYVVCHDCETTLGRKCEVYSRVVGYLRPVDQWNKGKQEEFEKRATYKIGENID